MKKKLAVLGSTTQVGQQALSVVAQHQELFTVEVLSTNNQVDLIVRQAKEFKPNAVVISDETAYEKVREALSAEDIKIFYGQDALCDVVSWDPVHLVLIASIGFQNGFRPTLAAIKAGKHIAMANKEVMAAAGKLIREKIIEKETVFLPVSNALSSIFQCLLGEDSTTISKVTLTASGGPFLGKKPNFLVNVKKDHALQHPNVTLDQKTAIDSATLMNKGLEMLAAKALFGLENDQIELAIHPESIIQSLVQFRDGSVKTKLGLPDKHTALLYALSFPERIENQFPAFSFHDYHKLSFDQPDIKTFSNLKLAQEVMEQGNNRPCVLNAANEVVVQAFLNNKVGFLEMNDMIEETMQQIPVIENPCAEDLEKTDAETRKLALSLTKKSQLFN